MRSLIYTFCIVLSGVSLRAQTLSFSVSVHDSIHAVPLPHARVELQGREGATARKVTSATGVATFRDIAEGWYRLTVRYISYTTVTDSILIDPSHAEISVGLVEEEHQDVVVLGEDSHPITTIDVQTGNQVFESATYHAPPSA